MDFNLELFRNYTLTRYNVTSNVVNYIENSLFNENSSIKYSFHKIMVQNWNDKTDVLFDLMTQYYSTQFIPILLTAQGNVISFYTSSLKLVLKIIKMDFIIQCQRSINYIDIILNDKHSYECFDKKVTIDDIVESVVSNRFNQSMELNLSNFCADPEFTAKNINFYKLSLLSYFKILMIRMGRDTVTLNLSNNDLSQAPVEILNFFIKGNLTAINLSHNQIRSIDDVNRMSSKIEMLWLEENPLCEDINPGKYIKQVLLKFPRLTHLDGIELNQHGITFPFKRNFLEITDNHNKLFVEKFVTQFFSHYDTRPRSNVNAFYDDFATFTLSAFLSPTLRHYAEFTRKLIDSKKYHLVPDYNVYRTRSTIMELFLKLPDTEHDLTTFSVDFINLVNMSCIVTIDGVFREPRAANNVIAFRRTFVLVKYVNDYQTVYQISNEMLMLNQATEDQVKNSFKTPIRNFNSLSLLNADNADKQRLIKVFICITQLRKVEAELRLAAYDWDIRKALQEFNDDMKMYKIDKTKIFVDDDEMSDLSSISEEID